MKIYLGDLHSHTGFSDGRFTPYTAFETAYSSGVDFHAITDHGEQLSSYEWRTTLNQAIAYDNIPHRFVAIRGFEWTLGHTPNDEPYGTVTNCNQVTNGYRLGHINVFGASDYTSTSTTKDIPAFYNWLDDRPDAIAQFNHPNHPLCSFDNLRYESQFGSKRFLIEVWNDTWDNHVSAYTKALDNGWYVVPTYGSDTHDADWGYHTDYRTGVVASSLTYNNIMEALRQGRTFATQDKELIVTMQVNGNWMGSIVSPGALNFEIIVHKSPHSERVKLELYRDGHRVNYTYRDSRTNWLKTENQYQTGHYYYVKAIGQASDKELYTAPIWIEYGSSSRSSQNKHDVYLPMIAE